VDTLFHLQLRVGLGGRELVAPGLQLRLRPLQRQLGVMRAGVAGLQGGQARLGRSQIRACGGNVGFGDAAGRALIFALRLRVHFDLGQ